MKPFGRRAVSLVGGHHSRAAGGHPPGRAASVAALGPGPVPAVSFLPCRVQPPLTCGIEEIVDCAWVSAEQTEDVPVIADWIAVHSACDTFG